MYSLVISEQDSKLWSPGVDSAETGVVVPAHMASTNSKYFKRRPSLPRQTVRRG